MKRARGSTTLVATLLLCLAGGCSGSSTPRTRASSPPAGGIPLTIVQPSSAPIGDVIYLAAGPDSLNSQLIRIEVRAGKATQVTRLPRDQGLSTIYAAGSHIVFASAGLGRDHPYRLNPDSTYVLLSKEPGFRPIVATNGDVAWARPASLGTGNRSGYEIHVLLAGRSRDLTVFTTELPVIAGAWLKEKRLALFVAGADAQIQILSLASKRIARTIKVQPEDAGYFAATPAGAFAVGSKEVETLIKVDGSSVPLPEGWHPLAFSPDGRTILVARKSGEAANELGFVSVDRPGTVIAWARLGLASLLDGSWTRAA